MPSSQTVDRPARAGRPAPRRRSHRPRFLRRSVVGARAQSPARPTVLVYRHGLLPISETFIKEQVGAYRRWRGVLIGRRATPGLELGRSRRSPAARIALADRRSPMVARGAFGRQGARSSHKQAARTKRRRCCTPISVSTPSRRGRSRARSTCQWSSRCMATISTSHGNSGRRAAGAAAFVTIRAGCWRWPRRRACASLRCRRRSVVARSRLRRPSREDRGAPHRGRSAAFRAERPPNRGAPAPTCCSLAGWSRRRAARTSCVRWRRLGRMRSRGQTDDHWRRRRARRRYRRSPPDLGVQATFLGAQPSLPRWRANSNRRASSACRASPPPTATRKDSVRCCWKRRRAASRSSLRREAAPKKGFAMASPVSPSLKATNSRSPTD